MQNIGPVAGVGGSLRAPIAAPHPLQGGPSGSILELVDVEMTTLPLMVFFRIAVREQASGQRHHVQKRFSDVVDFHRALERELEAPQWLLPRLPAVLPEKEYATPFFQSQMTTYIARLGRCPEALETYSFNNFFQLSAEYRRWEPQKDELKQPTVSQSTTATGLSLPHSDLHRPPTGEQLAPARYRERQGGIDSADCLLMSTASAMRRPLSDSPPSALGLLQQQQQQQQRQMQQPLQHSPQSSPRQLAVNSQPHLQSRQQSQPLPQQFHNMALDRTVGQHSMLLQQDRHTATSLSSSPDRSRHPSDPDLQTTSSSASAAARSRAQTSMPMFRADHSSPAQIVSSQSHQQRPLQPPTLAWGDPHQSQPGTGPAVNGGESHPPNFARAQQQQQLQSQSPYLLQSQTQPRIPAMFPRTDDAMLSLHPAAEQLRQHQPSSQPPQPPQQQAQPPQSQQRLQSQLIAHVPSQGQSAPHASSHPPPSPPPPPLQSPLSPDGQSPQGGHTETSASASAEDSFDSPPRRPPTAGGRFPPNGNVVGPSVASGLVSSQLTADGQPCSLSSEDVGSSMEASGTTFTKGRRRRPCVVCLAKPQEIAIDPCGHLSLCHRCAGAVEVCPMCRGPINKTLRVYMS
mmetsp:Transcript_2723/g.6588  ORF Transcript_2723/g.6588 Transcript_2723/m.6588 type:complete len:629 (-) Transcript_2723:174-2060(-)|eukprot:CAMPEP_0206450198 /NCGR_PEP_ID=MMETSP0324_2-20121206/18566_1 /ASSEMBLY_ACC=CAM_ASM_000836 /TAXON_ID=2866 /ORGANISM="Crypthecodinium cohnii, Strain Seligo" /LENGTH=628 /DNA_ID=CAMNT_0053919769 /DNA_START=156 /DNA_END=2042 /DNA_ORIENTATION=+